MKKTQIFTDNNNLYEADKAVKDFVKGLGKNLTDEERCKLGELLERRAAAISDVLGVKVGSVVLSRENKL
jgi:hypothetical protein